MLAKQAAAEAAKFVNHATDGSLALSPEGEYPQSYAFDEDADAIKAKLVGMGADAAPSSVLTPREWSMYANRMAGMENQRGEGRNEEIKTFGAYGPTTVVARDTGRPAPSWRRKPNGRQVYGAPYGFGSMYNMTPNQM